MPYKKKQTIRYAALSRLIIGYIKSVTGVAKILECSRATAKAKLDEPCRFTLSDLDALNRFGHIPKAEIIGSLTKET